jgi:hypothetical protein
VPSVPDALLADALLAELAGDGATIPGVGDTVSVTYVGHFADGTEYQGVQYGGKQAPHARYRPWKGLGCGIL